MLDYDVIMTSGTTYYTYLEVVMKYTNFDICTSSSFGGVESARTYIRTDKMVLYIFDLLAKFNWVEKSLQHFIILSSFSSK